MIVVQVNSGFAAKVFLRAGYADRIGTNRGRQVQLTY